MRVLGIDIGTTTIKGAVLDLSQAVVGRPLRLRFPEPLPSAVPGRHETSMDAVLEAVGSLLDQLLEEAPDAEHLFLCGQMHGVVVMTAQGKPLSPFISWQDRRSLEPDDRHAGTSLFDRLDGRLTEQERASMGNELRAGAGALTLAWLQETAPPPKGNHFATVCDAVLMGWTGQGPAVAPSFAASVSAYDNPNHQWNTDVIEKWNLQDFVWPEITQEVGPVCELTRGRHTLTVYPTLGDHQAALLGSALQASELSINISTGSQIAALDASFHPGSYQTRPFLGSSYLNTLTHLPAGDALNCLVALFTEFARARGHKDDPWPYIHEAVSQVPETTMAIDLSFFQCLTGNTSTFERVTEDTLRIGHFFRAAFQRMATNYHTYAKTLDPALPWETIALSGSLAQRSPALREEIARVFDKPLRVSTEEEETLRGLLHWAEQCLGVPSHSPPSPS